MLNTDVPVFISHLKPRLCCTRGRAIFHFPADLLPICSLLPLFFLYVHVDLMFIVRFLQWLDFVAACQVVSSVGTCPAVTACPVNVQFIFVLEALCLCSWGDLIAFSAYEERMPLFIHVLLSSPLLHMPLISSVSCFFGFLSSPPSDVPHFQTISRSWLSCLAKFLVTMRWVGNTHRNTSPGKVCHPCVSGSLREGWWRGTGPVSTFSTNSQTDRSTILNVWCFRIRKVLVNSHPSLVGVLSVWPPPTLPERAPDWDFV